MEDTQDSLFGRTSPARSAATEGETSLRSCKRSRLSAEPAFQYLSLNGKEISLFGEAQGASWETVGAWCGERLTRNTGECPSVAVESTLSQILVQNAPKKYFLSSTACAGIIRRATKRGKELPKMLLDALTEVLEQ